MGKKTNHRCTLAHLAALFKDIDLLEILIKQNTELNTEDKSGNRPIYYAIKKISEELNVCNGSHSSNLQSNPFCELLIKNLKKTKIKNPFQLLCCGDHYMLHPGTTRLLVSCYILPTKKIKGIYIWDEKMDKYPFILNYKHKEIKNPLKFLLKFSFLAPFKIKHILLNEKTDCSDKLDRETSDRMFQMAQKCFLSYNKNFETPFLTFHQSIHWEKIKKEFFFQDHIKFENDYCIIEGIKFKKTKNYWMKVD
jgi:hypothetical protein